MTRELAEPAPSTVGRYDPQAGGRPVSPLRFDRDRYQRPS